MGITGSRAVTSAQLRTSRIALPGCQPETKPSESKSRPVEVWLVCRFASVQSGSESIAKVRVEHRAATSFSGPSREESILDCAKPDHPLAPHLHPLRHHHGVRWAVEVGARSSGSGGPERRPRRAAGTALASADHARAISGSHRRQTVAEFAVSGAFVRQEDPVEVHHPGLQPRPVHCRHRCGVVRHGRVSRLPPQHLWQAEHRLLRSLLFSSLYWRKCCTQPWVLYLETFFLYATFTFATISGVHYVLITGHRLRKQDQNRRLAEPAEH